uniref:LAGLIDADG endonuclease n1 TaxGibberella zeae PH-1 RepIDA5J054_GIBZE n=1 Tax=Fusarium pseudograminearum CS5834 TaxID=1318459 RepID=W1IB70_FUSPS
MGDVPALSRIFNITSPQCGSSVYKPPQMTIVFVEYLIYTLHLLRCI